MLRPARIADPSESILSLAEVKAHLRIDFDEDDAMLGALIAAAESHLDGWSGVLGRCLVSQQWRADFACFTRTISLPFSAVSAVTIAYFDSDNVEQTFDANSLVIYEGPVSAFVRIAADAVLPATFARPDAVQITMTVGYGAAADVPRAITQAALLMIGHWYENREAVNVGNIVTEFPMAVDALLGPFRRRPI